MEKRVAFETREKILISQMKTDYFTDESIDKKAEEMLREVESYRKMRHINFSPNDSSLLIVDMQEYFTNEKSHAFVPSIEPVVPRIKKLANAFLENNLPVFSTRHINSKRNASLMSRWWGDLIEEKNQLSRITEELKLQYAGVIRKSQYDAFFNTSLEQMLRKMKATQLVITGVLSHLCCETTARSAFVKGFEVFFPVDGTATYNEDFHKASLLNLSHGFAIPVLINELLECMEGDEYGD